MWFQNRRAKWRKSERFQSQQQKPDGDGDSVTGNDSHLEDDDKEVIVTDDDISPDDLHNNNDIKADDAQEDITVSDMAPSAPVAETVIEEETKEEKEPVNLVKEEDRASESDRSSPSRQTVQEAQREEPREGTPTHSPPYPPVPVSLSHPHMSVPHPLLTLKSHMMAETSRSLAQPGTSFLSSLAASHHESLLALHSAGGDLRHRPPFHNPLL